jgi:sn-glycerol 3-phosphate transport system substrate-binding protein
VSVRLGVAVVCARENMHAYHDQPFADQSNGFDGLATSLKVNGPFGVKMMELLARGAKEGWFTYGGWPNKAAALLP